MKTYKIQFCYYSDVRAEEIVETTNEVAALAIAQARKSEYNDWTRFSSTEGMFHIKIKGVN